MGRPRGPFGRFRLCNNGKSGFRDFGRQWKGLPMTDSKPTIEEYCSALVSTLNTVPVPGDDPRVKDARRRLQAFAKATSEAITDLQAQVTALQREVAALRAVK